VCVVTCMCVCVCVCEREREREREREEKPRVPACVRSVCTCTGDICSSAACICPTLPLRTQDDEPLPDAVVGGHRVLLLEVAGSQDGGAPERRHVEAQLLGGVVWFIVVRFGC
jgi:hypothetical protein